MKLKCGREIPAPERNQTSLEKQRKALSDYLIQEGLRFTEPRWKVVQAILSSGKHVDSSTIAERVRQLHPDVGAATVYRTIKLLCDAGILSRSHQSTSGQNIYELSSTEHHDHILCADCGATFEFHDKRLEAAQERIAVQAGFSLSDHHHVLVGHCSYLTKNKREKKHA